MKKTLAFSLLFCIFLIGCQKTPSNNTVVNKNDRQFENNINDTISQDTTIANTPLIDITNWEENFSTDVFSCRIDTTISVPQQKTFPVFLVKKRTFNSAELSKLLDYFTSDAIGMRPPLDTKLELESMLINARRGIYDINEYGEYFIVQDYNGKEERIAELEQELRDYVEPTIEKVDNSNIVFPLERIYDYQNGGQLYVNCSETKININTGKYHLIQNQSWIADGGFPNENDTSIIQPSLSEQDATNTITKLIDDLSLNDYAISHVEKARIIDDNVFDILSEGWVLTLNRSNGGYIPFDMSNVQTSGLLDYYSPGYVERWGDESISVYVDSDGVKRFMWSNPLSLEETATENVALLGFDEIKIIIKQSIETGMAWLGSQSSGITIIIDNITLSNVLIPIKDDREHQYLAPAWIISYRFTEEGVEPDNNTNVFAINAVDGSIIDLQRRTNIME